MAFFHYFISVVLMSLFWSFSITTIVYALQQNPVQDINFIVEFQNADLPSYQETGQDFQTNLQSQKQFGIVDAGALALFSGNLLLDLTLNFFFAVPNMFYLFFSGIFAFLHINVFLQKEIILWVQIVLSVISTIFLFQFLLGARTQSLGVI